MPLREGWEGRFFEDFEVGDIYRHPLGRSITATDNAWFTLVTMNTNELHFNDHYSSRTEFNKQLVNSTLTLAIVVGLSVTDISRNAVANLGWDKVRIPHPVFIGDTLYAESMVLAARPSSSRPYAGIVTVATQGLNQDGEVVLTFERSVMVYRRDAAQLQGTFPEANEPIERLRP
ncbi:MAG TPA: MaoC family dehydratase [Acidimicrobiia bacterium]